MHAIKLADLQYINGTFYDYASDVAYMTPAIELVGTRLKFLKELNYEYRFDTGANEPHQQQMVVEYQVYDKAPSKKMEEMSFADNSKTVHYP
jgi:2-keto-4-pentenoate hydratase